MPKWYDKYLSIYGKSYDELPEVILDEIKGKLADFKSKEPVISFVGVY